ncbi:Eco57I restriction-modification methylase domain-containing protein [Treponema sp. R6D11]
MSVIFGITVDTDAVDKSFGESFGGWDDIQKALTHKYIRRIPKKSGKGYWYIYAETFQKPLAALKTFFGLQTKAISDTYEKNDIKKDFGADKKTFAAHLLEYLSNKLKWDTFFKKKENNDGFKAPKKSPPTGTGGGKNTGGVIDKNVKRGDNKIVLNRSLMRRIWGIYNKTEEENGTNNIGNERGEIPDVAPAVRSGGSEEDGDQYVSSAETGDNGGEPLQLPVNTGERPARDIRLTKKQTINIREACLELLNSKTDDQMTEEDKALLRQYEGAGGLGEEGASTHGTLYEYYTPRTVTKKVWEIVDKYIPGKKNVLEPSSGIGRFAEDRPDDKFVLNEFDKTSARIAGILHPDQLVIPGAFQEMFKPGKEGYKGQKYDVVIGNPPYGAYEGLWKGRGEGKGHTRYEEYFIDRGLDTMREGGIMAFVVPSDFLRKGNSKIKEKIAAKGKLLEAWRLPNGTFNTTGVGTDIIIIRKEPGDSADFSDNAFFEKNPDMVMGTETTRVGRYGKEESFIGLADGESFDEAIDRIRADKMEAVPVGAKTQAEQAEENVKVVVKEGNKKSRLEKPSAGRTRSEAMMGNDNAAGSHDVDSLEEFNKKYNKNIPRETLALWEFTNWDGSIDVARLEHGRQGLLEYMQKSGNYVQTADGKWYDIVNFASGNIYQKLKELERDKDDLTATEYKRQKAILESAKPTPKTVHEFMISPLSDFAIKYVIEEELNDKQDSLIQGFKDWVWELGTGSVPPSITKHDIIDYVNRKSVRADSKASDKEAAARERDNTIKVRREATEALFNQFIREQLSTQEQERMAEMWNRQFNAVVDPDHTKIPAFVDGISRTFKGDPLKVSDIQLKGVATLVNRGNGILAYDVGVGKTLTGILATVSQIQTGRAKNR